MSLAGRTMLVTGASSGIGRAIALAAARAGADVAITYRANEAGAREVERAIRALGRRAARHQARRGQRRVAARARAGRSRRARPRRCLGQQRRRRHPDRRRPQRCPIRSGSICCSPWTCAGRFSRRGAPRRCSARRTDGGVIINMSWDHVLTRHGRHQPADVRGGRRAACWRSASRSRDRSRRACASTSSRPAGSRPSFGEGLDERAPSRVAESTPLERWGTPDDVAGAAVFLASPAAAFLTGQTILVGGGVVM